MDPKEHNEETILEQALTFRSTEAREAYLQGACGSNRKLRDQLESLIQAHEAAGGFLPEKATPSTPALSGPETMEENPGQIGHYKLLQKIGEGGCGIVYTAEQEQPVRRRVALKVIKLGMDTRNVIARFEAERQALALMDHPNIAKVLEAGSTKSGRPYFVMELVRGVKITDYCDQQKLSTQDRLNLFTRVCQAVQHAHQKGIIHRDIKPSNILVTLHDGVPVPKVIDFGIAKATTDQRLTDKTLFTVLEHFIGTPAYMSPEQAEMSGLDIDTRTDIYALGVLLYELLTGRTPFDAQELMTAGLDEMRRTIREQEPIRPSTRLNTMLEGDLSTIAQRRQIDAPKLISLLQGDLDWVVMKALEKDRTRRYETANGLAVDIQHHLKNEPVAARPPSTAYRLQKLVRRNKLGFAAASAVALTLIAGLTFSIWAFVRERKARASEVFQRQAAEQQKAVAQAAQRETAQHLASSRRSAYDANLNLAQLDWGQDNLARVWTSLEETREYEDRGFEWFYWQREMHRDVRTLRGHLDRIGGLAISPNGRWIATASNDATLKVWDFATGREVSTCLGHTNRVRSVAFFPDNHRIVSCANDGTICIWEATTGEVRILQRDTASVLHVAVSSEPARIVSGNGAGMVKVWDGDTGRELHALRVDTPPDPAPAVWAVAISADGHRILAGSSDGKVRLWDLRQGEKPVCELIHRSDDRRSHATSDYKSVWSVAFSPDEKSVVSASQDGTVKLWDAFSGQLLHSLTGPGAWVFSAGFSPDSRQIVTGSGDGRVRVWASDTGEELQSIKGHRGAVWSVAFAPDGQTIVTSGGEGDHTAKVWDLANASGPLTLTNGPSVWSVAFSPDTQWLATGGQDGTIRIWNIVNGNPARNFQGHTAAVYSVAFCPQGQRLVSGSSDGTARVWNLDGKGQPLVFTGHKATINSVAFSPDGRMIASASDDKTVKLWDAFNSVERLTFTNHEASVRAVAFSPRGDWIASGGEDSAPRIWDCISGRQRQHLVGTEGKRTIFSLAVSPDGQRIAAARWLSTVTVWDTASERYLFDLNGHTMDMTSAAFSPDGRRLVTGNSDRLVKLWDASTGRELLTLRGHGSFVQSVAFSPDGIRIASGSHDGTAKIWVAATPEQVAVWENEDAQAVQRLEKLRRERLAGNQQ